MSAATTPVLEVGGTHVTAALVTLCPDGPRVRHQRREPLACDVGADEILETLLHCARSLPLAADPPATGWGVALPGPFDYADGIARYQDVGKFDALRGVNVGEQLRAGLPGNPRVAFVNDAVAFLRGEWAHGAAAGHQHAAGITLGTGVGSAFLAQGSPVDRGPQVPPQGRADLLSHDGRPLEDTISRRALIDAYLHATGERLDVREVAAAARAGEPAAREVVEHAFTALGRTLAPWLRRFRATVLVVGGSMTGSWDLVGPLLEAGLADGADDGADPASAAATPRMVPALRVTPARHPDQAALIGAALHALDGADTRRGTGPGRPA